MTRPIILTAMCILLVASFANAQGFGPGDGNGVCQFIDEDGDDETVVGASTGLPMIAADEAFRAPFIAAGIDPARVFYFGESVLLPEYRGQGIGQHPGRARAAFGPRWAARTAADSLRNAQELPPPDRHPPACTGCHP